jgi:sarcosine oxidase subunit alpha
MSGERLPSGGLIDRDRTIEFKFDGRRYTGHGGDTLASALIANGVSIVGRSFKYHRPRGVYTAGPEEPNALVTVGSGAETEPNCRATMVELYDGLVASSQNNWPGLRFDLMAVNQLAAPLLSAGFYYKTFMGPTRRAWRFYEHFIRRAAGMGRAGVLPDPARYETINAFVDVLVAGAGPAGLLAGLTAARSGARVMVVDENPMPGGSLAGDSLRIGAGSATAWTGAMASALAGHPNALLLTRATAYGCYDGNTVAIVERVADHRACPTKELPRQRHWIVRARQVVIATGAFERPAVFENNDLPGIMLAESVRRYLNRFAVVPGRKIAFLVSNDGAYRSVADLARAGVHVACIVDCRRTIGSEALRIAAAADCELLSGHIVRRANGRATLRSVDVVPIDAGMHRGCSRLRRISVDCLAVSAGWTPACQLATHAGEKLRWHEQMDAFVPADDSPRWSAAGAVTGLMGTSSCMRSGVQAAQRALEASGIEAVLPDAPEVTDEPVPGRPVPMNCNGVGRKAFVDLQHDVTVGDIHLAHREGFRAPEHLKRYTTLGMAADQGKTSSLNGLRILGELENRPMSELGATRFRPPCSPVALGALAGTARGRLFRPTRRTPVHEWHVANGADMVSVGTWLRPQAYPRPLETVRDAGIREADHVRRHVGIVDVSTLGKIEVQGPDSTIFLDRVYANNWHNVAVGKARYGLMLREDGIVFDDGTSWRLDENRYLMTTTTANAGRVLSHLELLLVTAWPELRVTLTPVTDQWCGIAVAGPGSRRLLSSVVEDVDLSNDACPVMAVREAQIRKIPVLVCRLSFSGELAYEVYVPADFGCRVWELLLDAGRAAEVVPYGTEALGILRIEKGHVAGPELDGRTTADDLGFGGLLSGRKQYVGSAMLERPGLTDPARPKLVGLLSRDGEQLDAGSQIVEPGDGRREAVSLGHVSSAAFSPALGRHIALALVRNGRQMIGERLIAANPLKRHFVSVKVVAPCFFDESGSRMRA